MSLINREDLIAEYDRVHVGPPGGARKLMVDAPEVDPVRNGKWIEKPNVHGVAYCSLCDYELHTNDTNYCPNCGAKMEGCEQDG